MRFAPAVSLIALIIASPSLAQTAEPAGAAAQAAPAPTPTGNDTVGSEIIVTAPRAIQGAVQTSSAPVVELDEQQVQSYGASSIQDLISQLAPEIGSGRGRGGRPVFLVNGQRISNFREIFRYPPEAIKRLEILPEEVALKYGFPPDQRVINFILKDNFRSLSAEVDYGRATQGGGAKSELQASQLAINGKSRLNASIDYKHTSPITEAERDVVQTPGSVPTLASDPNPADFRSLAAKDSTLEVDFTSTNGLGKDGADGQFTINTQVIHEDTLNLSGLDLVTLTSPDSSSARRAIDAKPLTRQTLTDTYSLGSTFNKNLGGYQFTTTLDSSYTSTDSRIDRSRTLDDPAVQALVDAAQAGTLAINGDLPNVPRLGFDRAQNRAYDVALKSTLIGNPFELPAGEADVTLNAGYDWSRNESTDTRRLAGDNALIRGDLSAGANIGIPIASRRNDVLSAIGDLTFNLSGGFDYLSDFGTLGNWTGGLVWKPSKSLTLQGAYIERETAPGLSQLGGPSLISYNVPVYDFRTGQTVLVTQTSGGNPNLLPEHQRDFKLSANYDLPFLDRANILVEYYHNRSNNVTASFPLLTPAIEAAFPDRVTRDTNGQLLAIDARPVTFAETRSDRIRYGFNLFGKVGKPSPEEQSGGGRGRFGRLMSAARPAGESNGQQQSGSRPGFDPQRFAQLREQFCATPTGQVPDLSALPQQMQDRLKGADGKPDPAKIAAMRTRFCSADAAQRFDPERFAALRKVLCQDPGKKPDLSTLPPGLQARLKGPDGKVDPAKLKQLESRICAAPGQGNSGSGEQQQAARGSDNGSRSSGGRGNRGFSRGNGQGRWSLSFYHTINLDNSILVAPGGPTLDLMNGDATGSSGGVARQQFELDAGLFYKGIGTRISGNYSTGTTVQASGVPGSSDLHFGGLATFNLRLFVALDQQKWLVGDNPGFLNHARLSLHVNNIFDAYQKVTDANGVVPISYQPALLDPYGRFVKIEFRKLF
ncbi:hypothetical protein GRI58_00345 [Porphyrobacter algicida]|uniref:TonB-dependent receptor n=1 Tax=Qipengyuania algicida TaxID=1836209 RepID=A0A845AE77_9SPHN|nr:hypothetical protein [Qipengyuania algicida]